MQSIFFFFSFRDMHYERDVIQTNVVPAVHAIAAKYGESISAFDLRWGVNTADLSEESSAKKVLDVVIKYIKSFPCGEAEYCWLSYEPENIHGKLVYDKYGFIENGEMCYEEIVSVYKL